MKAFQIVLLLAGVSFTTAAFAQNTPGFTLVEPNDYLGLLSAFNPLRLLPS
jgi:hypothetical protein